MTTHQPGSRFQDPKNHGGAQGPQNPALVAKFGGSGSEATARPWPGPDMIARAIAANRADTTIRKGGY